MRTLARLETGEGEPREETVAAIRSALSRGGILFIEENGAGPGVRLRRRA